MAAFLEPYHLGIAALAVLALMVMIQGFVAGFQKNVVMGISPGADPETDHDERTFRIHRTFANSIENLTPLVLAAAVAMAAGAHAAMVNWLIVAHVGLRIVFWVLYYGGIGKPAGGPRTITFVASALISIALGVVALIAVF